MELITFIAILSAAYFLDAVFGNRSPEPMATPKAEERPKTKMDRALEVIVPAVFLTALFSVSIWIML